MQFFHPGLYYDHTVQMNVIDPDGVHPVPFSPERFDYGKNTFADRIPADIGYAGFRIHYPIKNPNYLDELIVFLGASYFRALGRDNVYGLSARGLAIDTVEPSGEEFPAFIEYWLVDADARRQPPRGLRAAWTAAASAGAYRFDITPGVETDGRRPGAPLPAPPGRQARPRAAHQHVLLRREQHAGTSTTSVPRCTTRTACWCTSTAANGCGARSTTRRASTSAASPPRTRAASG